MGSAQQGVALPQVDAAVTARNEIGFSVQIEQIEIHSDDLDRPYESLGNVRAKATAATLFSRAPTIEEVNFKLREKAAALGANAVIRVIYDRGMSMTSYKALTAIGVASGGRIRHG